MCLEMCVSCWAMSVVVIIAFGLFFLLFLSFYFYFWFSLLYNTIYYIFSLSLRVCFLLAPIFSLSKSFNRKIKRKTTKWNKMKAMHITVSLMFLLYIMFFCSFLLSLLLLLYVSFRFSSILTMIYPPWLDSVFL